MLRKLLATLGWGAASAAAAGAAEGPPFSPYASEKANTIYNLLFCDDPSLFKGRPGEHAAPWQTVIFASPVDVAALEALASDASQEGRVRYLAFSRLRELGKPVRPKQILGVIVEVALSGGLDTLAAFAEGGVRYINQSGKMVVLEGVESFLPMVERLLAASEPVVARIGPWEKPRLKPPQKGGVRLTFLVSDGLYFGEGPISVMQHEPMAGPIIQQATALLQAVVAVGTK